ncbi:MAG: tryptophan 2,3-dioxygenase family protein [Bacteriovoracaceae bacterium]
MKTYYRDYLGLNTLLDSQKPMSFDTDNPIQDEMLFIIVHQVYELWFKQMLHELKQIQELMSVAPIREKELNIVSSKFQRIKAIQGLMTGPLEILETMTPMDFLEFRDLIVPASGFQSVQFREIEIRLGLTEGLKSPVDRKFFMGRMDEQDQNHIRSIGSNSLFHLVEGWLERMPFGKMKNFNFWKSYEAAVNKMLDSEKNIIEENQAELSSELMETQLQKLNETQKHFESLMDEEKYKALIESGNKRLSQKATLNALFILLYRSEPLLHQPFQILTHLMDIDENFTSWRYRHSILAQRMLGRKIGTGGSSGHEYLKRTAEQNRVFLDIFDLSSFLIPNRMKPTLPTELKEKLSFHYEINP